MNYKLSILIPTIYGREHHFNALMRNLSLQLVGYEGQVEILECLDNREESTGAKRNKLIEAAQGEYVVFIDDDDTPQPQYIKKIMEAIEHKPDVIPINGYMTTNNSNPVYWEMGLGFEYCAKSQFGRLYYSRFPNHIAPMKRELIKDFKFKDVTIGEDYDWAKRINDAGILKTEVRITEAIYHYNYIQK